MNLPSLDFSDLAVKIAALPNPKNLTDVQRENLWRDAVQLQEQAVLDGALNSATANQIILGWLTRNAGCLATSPKALRGQYYRKLAQWETRGSLADGRREANKAKRGPDFSKPQWRPDRKVFLHSVVYRHNGDLDTAWAECLREKKFS